MSKILKNESYIINNKAYDSPPNNNILNFNDLKCAASYDEYIATRKFAIIFIIDSKYTDFLNKSISFIRHVYKYIHIYVYYIGNLTVKINDNNVYYTNCDDLYNDLILTKVKNKCTCIS